MKQIVKMREPRLLKQHKSKQFASFDNIPIEAKKELRNNLLIEQGYICCYCMRRIHSEQMKIEHFKCQNYNEELQLEYSNLLGVCLGGEGSPMQLQTCDTRKRNLGLSINPSAKEPNCESFFKYNANGEISSNNNDEEVNRQIEDVLNLNMQTLKDYRREVYLVVQRKIETESKKQPDKHLKIGYLTKERDRWLSKCKEGKFKEFCMVAVYYLNKKIKANL